MGDHSLSPNRVRSPNESSGGSKAKQSNEVEYQDLKSPRIVIRAAREHLQGVQQTLPIRRLGVDSDDFPKPFGGLIDKECHERDPSTPATVIPGLSGRVDHLERGAQVSNEPFPKAPIPGLVLPSARRTGLTLSSPSVESADDRSRSSSFKDPSSSTVKLPSKGHRTTPKVDSSSLGEAPLRWISSSDESITKAARTLDQVLQYARGSNVAVGQSFEVLPIIQQPTVEWLSSSEESDPVYDIPKSSRLVPNQDPIASQHPEICLETVQSPSWASSSEISDSLYNIPRSQVFDQARAERLLSSETLDQVSDYARFSAVSSDRSQISASLASSHSNLLSPSGQNPKATSGGHESDPEYDVPRSLIPVTPEAVQLRKKSPQQSFHPPHFTFEPPEMGNHDENPPPMGILPHSGQHYTVSSTLYAKAVPRLERSLKEVVIAPPILPPRNTPHPSNRSSNVTLGPRASSPFGCMDSSMINMESMACARCEDGFEPRAKIVNSNGVLFHPQCFVCAQCFRSFPDGVFYEFEERKYCEHCFHVLYAPCCGKCGEFIIGRVIKAMSFTWHPQCFTCEMCTTELADLGFTKNQGRALCHECNAKVKAQGVGRYMCQKCHSVIDGEPLRFRGEVYHPYHFNCTGCSTELTSTAREVRTRPGYTANELNELYCLRCHDKMGIPICGACRRPIEERVVTALGKHWHVEHFVCAKCEKPFHGNRHYERKGLAYCETHYHQLFGNLCYVCNLVIQGDVFTALNKAWCVNHFACSSCDQKMTVKTKFYEVDLKPVCKKCYDKYPRELRLRLKKYHENEAARDQTIALK